MAVDERLAVIETKLDGLKNDMAGIPKLVTQHSEWIKGIQANLKWLWGVLGAVITAVLVKVFK